VLGGFGLAFVLENVDTRLYDVEQVKNITKLPILCWLPSVSGLHSPKILADQFPYNHAFQRLSIILQNKVQERHLRTILITSPESNVGRSTVAVNLAVSLAQSGCKTLLVDADNYKPTIHQYFGLANRTGVCNFLYSGVVPKDIIQTTDIENLSVMTSGPRMEDRAYLIQGGKQIKKLLENLSKQYDFVILDTPASLELANSMLLAPLVDGVLVVIRLGITRPSCIKITCQQLGYVSANMIGIVVNDVGNMYSGKNWRGASMQKNSYLIYALKRALVVNKVRREEQVQRSIISQKET
jgi:capsular exopolysaccharide synthesis family protein